MPAPVGNQNRLTHGIFSQAEPVCDDHPADETESFWFRQSLPPLKDYQHQTRQANQFRRDKAKLIEDVHGDSAIDIAEDTISKGPRKGQHVIRKFLNPYFEKVLRSATLDYRSSQIAGKILSDAGKPGDVTVVKQTITGERGKGERTITKGLTHDQYQSWLILQNRFEDACDRKLKELGLDRLTQKNEWESILDVPEVKDAQEAAQRDKMAEDDRSHADAPAKTTTAAMHATGEESTA